MIAGLPWTSWLLMLASGGLGLALALAFYLAQRDAAAGDDDFPRER